MTSKPKLYLDACCFIDVVKHAVGLPMTTNETSNVWFIKKMLEAHRDGLLLVHTSILSVAECVSVEPGQEAVSHDVQERFRSLLTSGQYVYLLNPTPKTATLVQRFRWDHKLVLGSADAIHFASALEQGCTEFITNDGRFKKNKLQRAIPALSELGMRVISPSATKILPDSSRQMPLEAAQQTAH